VSVAAVRTRLPGAGRLRLPQRDPRPVEDARMTLVEHLRELRARLFKAILAIVTVTAVCLFLAYDPINRFITKPYCDVPAQHRFTKPGQPDSCALIIHGPLDAFTYRLKIALIAGIVLSAPVWLYQLWAFITPGLHRHERRYSLGFLAASTVLFAAGSALSYFVLKTSLTVLLEFGGDNLVALLTASEYLGFVIGMLLVFGLAFEFPLLVVMLNFAGILSSERLRAWRRLALFACIVFAGVATPSTDPFTMLALAVPLMVLYEASVTVARLHDRRVRKREANSPYAALGDDETSPLELVDPAAARVAPNAPNPPNAPADHGDIT